MLELGVYITQRKWVTQFIAIISLEVALVKWEFQSIIWSVYFALSVFPLLKIYRYTYSKWQHFQPDSHFECIGVVLPVYITIYIEEILFGIIFCFKVI